MHTLLPRLLSRMLTGAALVAGVVLAGASAVRAQLVVMNETFTGTTLAPSWQLGGTNYTPTLTAATGIDTPGSGWLRLTSAGGNQATYAYDTTSFNAANATIAVKFSYAAYGGTGADGITFFLADASKTFGVGAYGGSLGYAQKTAAGGGGADISGMSGGYIGLGIDEFGNYANATEGRIGGEGFIPGNVSVRGPGQGLTGYDYIGGSGALSTPIAFSGNTRPTGDDERIFQIIITATNQLTVYMQAGATGPMEALYSVDLSGYARPEDLVMGFTGSTGGSTNIHEVQGLSLASLAATIWKNAADTNTSAGEWAGATNWDGDAVPDAGADILLDNHFVSSAQAIDVGGSRFIRSVQIDAPFSYTLNNGTLTFSDQGVLGPSGIFVSQGNGVATHTIDSALVADNAIEIKNSSTGALNLTGTLATNGNAVALSGSGDISLSGVISGTGSIAKRNGGNVTLSGNNTFSGGSTLQDGTLTVAHNNALGTGDVTLKGGTLASDASNTVGNAMSLQGDATLNNLTTSGTLTQTGGNRTLTLVDATHSGVVNLSNNNTSRTLTLQVDSGTSTVSGVIQNGGTGAGSVTKAGTGTLVIGGNNTFTGTTSITAGTVQLGASDRLADTSGVNIGGLGTLNLAGFSEKIGTLTATGGATLNYGTPGGANTFIFGNYVAPSSGVLVVNNWETGLDKLASTVAGQNVSTIYISGFGVAQQAGSTSAMGGSYGSAYLLTPIATPYKEWNGSSSSTWATNNNWTSSGEPLTTEVALFNSLGLGRTTVNLGTSDTVAGIRFGTGATSSYNLTSSANRTLTLAGTVPYIQQQSASNQTIGIVNLALSASTVADITGAGNLTISSRIAGTGVALIKDGNGAGKLILSGNNTFTGGLYVNNGTVQANSNTALGTGAATLSSGSTLEISGGRSINNAFSLSGTGVGGLGAIRSVNGTNILNGTITQTGATTLAADAGTALNLTGNLTGTNQDTTLAGAGNLSINQITTGTGSVTLAGTGTVTYAGAAVANTYTGSTNVNSGTLSLAKTAGTNAIIGDLVVGDGVGAASSAIVQLAAANQIANGVDVTINSDGLFNLNGQGETIGALAGAGVINNSNATATTLTFGNTGATTFSGLIQDTGGNLSLIKQGSGKITLSGANTYAGTTALTNGILAIQNNTALGSGAVTVSSGGNLEVSGSLNVANAFTLNGGGTLANDGAIQSTAGSNTLTGAITLQSASRIEADSGSSLTLTNNISGTGLALTFGGAGTTTVNGNILTGTAGTLIKDGSGTLILNPGGTSNYTGATSINEGTLEIRKASGLGTAAAGTTVASGATLAISGGITTTEPLTLNGSGVGSGGALRNLSGTNTVSGTIAVNSASTIGVDAGTLTASGIVSGAGGNSVTKIGAGTLTLSGTAANTFAGDFNVSDGAVNLGKTAGVSAIGPGNLSIGDGAGAANSAVVQLVNANQIGATANVSIASDGQLNLNGRSETIGSLAGSGNVTMGTGNVLTVGNTTSTTFSGALSTSGSGAVTKTGIGTLTISGADGANSFAAAALNLVGGTVQLGANNILSGNLNFNGGLFSVNGFNDTVSSATLTSSSVLDFNSLAGVFDFTNGIYTAGTLTINGWAGSINGGGASQLRLPGTVTGALLANITFAGYGAGAQIVNGEIVPITGISYSWNVTASGNWTADGNWTPDPAGTGVGPDAAGASVVFGSAITADSTVTVAGTKTVGYMAFNDNNKYTLSGGTVNLDVASGSAQINVSNTGGGTIASAITLADALQISQNSSSLFTISGGISGTARNITVGGSGDTLLSGIVATTTGTLTKNNAGKLTLSGANTFTGGTTINGGTLAISADNNLGGTSGALTFNSGTLETTATLTLSATRAVTIGATGGTLQTASATTLTYNGILAGTGTLTKAGTGTFITGGASANTHSGNVAVNEGVFQVAKSAAVSGIADAAAVSVASGATLRFSGTGAYVAETVGSLAGAGNITNASANTLNLSSGGTNASTLFSGVIGNTGGALSLTKTGTGTLTLSGANTYTGTTAITQGVLNIQNNTALGATSTGTTVSSGAALELQGGIAVGAEALSLNGTGVSSGGALRNISGTNSFAGAVTLGSASTIRSDAGTLTLGGTIGGAAQNLTLDGPGNLALSGAITTTTGTLTKNGTGYATLSGTSTFTGATAVNAGTLEIRSASALGTTGGGVAVASGATLALGGSGTTFAAEALTLNGVGDGSSGALRNVSGNNTYSGTVALGSTSLVGVESGTTLTTSGVISGAAGSSLVKVGSGTLVLTGANTYTGSTVINDGTVQINADTRLGPAPGTVTAAQLTFNGGTLATTFTGSLATNRGVSLATGGGTISTATSTTITYAGVVAGTGDLTKSGAGTLVLTGNNTYSGSTHLNGGTLSINSDARLGTAPVTSRDNSITFNGGTLATTASLTLNANRDMLVEAGGGTLNVANATTVTFGGDIDGSGALALALNSTGVLDFTSNIDFSAGTLLLGGGTLRLSGINLAVETFHITGNTILDFGNNASSTLTAANFIVNAGVTVTVNNWVNGIDYFFVTDSFMQNGGAIANPGDRGSTPENQIVFNGFSGNSTMWHYHDRQITPVPEPATYGAIFVGLSLGAVALIRYRRRSR